MHIDKTDVLRCKYLLNGKEVDSRVWEIYGDIMHDRYIKGIAGSHEKYLRLRQHSVLDLLGSLLELNVGCRQCHYSIVDTTLRSLPMLLCMSDVREFKEGKPYKITDGTIIASYGDSCGGHDLISGDTAGPIGCTDIELKFSEDLQMETTLKGFQLF